jgi:hypothetical protein
MQGEILALSPWVIDDPIKTSPQMSLAERRVVLEKAARQLLPGGTLAYQYRESVIWADTEVPVEISCA